MKRRKTLGRIFTGVLAALAVVALSVPAAVAVPAAPAVTMAEQQNQVSASYDALDIYPQEQDVLTPKFSGMVVSDTTSFSASAPEGTVVLFVIGGVVSNVDPAKGEWQIGSP